jgi:hypothetical protein
MTAAINDRAALVAFVFFRSPDLPISSSPLPLPLPYPSQIGVEFRGMHPRASQFGVGLTHQVPIGVGLMPLGLIFNYSFTRLPIYQIFNDPHCPSPEVGAGG